ncbi:MAG: glutamine-hydrolyzing GMP synthase [Trueperaceae bacterium]|nr:glutamine-hydrolyzing GMP synthase [Trueperaceae bacterium]
MASIVVLDYGSQYTRLIARRLRELNVYSVILSANSTLADIQAHDPVGVVLSGGPRSVYDEGAPQLPDGLLGAGLPTLAICYGMQLVARAAGGEVRASTVREYGKATLEHYQGELFGGVEGDFVAWMSHGDSVATVPPGFEVVAATADTPVAAMEDRERGIYGLQFHPEVQHTPKGVSLLENFVERTGVGRDWTPEQIVAELDRDVRTRVGDERVLLGISGGVDSSTLGLLLHHAIGAQLFAVFVDHGLLRLGEAAEVEAALRDTGVNLSVIDASERFLSALEGVSDPEQKRKIIGREFIEVFSGEAKRLQTEHGGIRFLAQGTLYPDVIESAGGYGAANIKSHHNVGGLPEKLDFELLEPFRTLFKDEVRDIARTLGLPAHLRDRHPFPGPGLAIRCLGEVTRDRLEVLRRVDDIFISALREFGLYDDTWQALAVLTPLRSVGVMGDERTYANTVALRAVGSRDGMTADWTRFPHEFLATVSNRIVNSVFEVNRVVYDITSKPPGTIEWE